ncbi:MAG: hypothetical protein KAI83_12220 [Thiomargarita sp.]|nr:hypothetical protein [Thiomargarita sp.]
MKDFFIHFLTPSLFFTLLFVSFVGAAEGDNQEPTEFEFEFKSTQSRGTIMGEDDTTNFFFEPRVVVGMHQHSYEEKYTGKDSDDVKWEDNMPFAGLGITLGYKNFSVDVYAQQSASGKAIEFETSDSLLRDKNIDNLSRKDYAINFSYAMNLFKKLDDRVVFSTGYKVGHTNISGTSRYISTSTGGINYSPIDTQFETNGPTVGISYGFPIGEGVIGLNLAYAWLKTDYTSPEMEVTPESTSGLTLGLLWSSPITNNLMFSFSADYYKYTMGAESAKTEFEDALGRVQRRDIQLNTIEESVVSIKTSLSYAFDF